MTVGPSLPHHQHHQHHPNDNVVDYYAIVGVGDTLEFQSSSSSSVRNSHSTTTPSSSPQRTTAPPSSDDDDGHCNVQEMERFLREIIHVYWITSDDSDDQTNHASSTTTQLRFDASFYLSYQRRRDTLDEEGAMSFSSPQRRLSFLQQQQPAVAELKFFHVRIHRDLLFGVVPNKEKVHRSNGPAPTTTTKPPIGSSFWWSTHNQRTQFQHGQPSTFSSSSSSSIGETHNNGTSSSTRPQVVSLQSYLTLPANFQEWSIPGPFQQIYDPDAVFAAVTTEHSTIRRRDYYPSLVVDPDERGGVDDYCDVPILAIRRQAIADEQRYHEDAAMTDIRIVVKPAPSHKSQGDDGPNHCINPSCDEEEDDDDDENDNTTAEEHHAIGGGGGAYHGWLSQTKWTNINPTSSPLTVIPRSTIQIRRNRPHGFCDVTVTTRVIGRFPYQNYDTVPLPMEEIPMFCYPKLGCTLVRTQYSNVPPVQYYGFVVKNERGDSIYVSCVSFMEPLITAKINQLEQLSYQRRHASLPHYRHYIEQQQQRRQPPNSGCLVTAFTDMTTFENKTICLVSRYPYWTAFRKFLSHLHLITSSSVPSTIPIERYISHLLLSIQLPRPGGPSTIVPLPALNTPMILSLPHEKDLPLLDLPLHRLFSCLTVKTIVTIVLGLLSLERKVVIMSTRPSLVLDIAELLRSLLFPFELCAPYVPRLTEPFKSSLDFPGAIFVGIHDDGDPNGLAAMVKAVYPEESTIIDLDSGEMDCDGDRHEILASLWNIIPSVPRSALVNELEALCRDADIVDGQEPLESLMDSAFYVDLTDAVDGNDINVDAKKSLDDRGVRDTFLRFFCSVLGGYERFLVVPDANFLVSGDDWFDATGFLTSVPSENMPYLTSLVSTQLFQSFIQRRTEASDIHCMLFDECLTEFHSTTVPYGRLGGDVEAIRSDESSHPQMLYSLLVDQSASLTNAGYDPTSIAINRSMDASEADSSFTMNMSRAVGSVAETSVMHSDSVVSYSGDLITIPSSQDLPPDRKYIYCLDGNPYFPHNLDPDLFLPREPSSWTITLTKTPDPLLARSERELEEANRRRRVAMSQLGVTQRRCLWQLPKLFGSHFLGAWLLCTPALVSQAFLSHDQQSKYLLRALGALRLLRSRHRIVPDEAAYRALLVACGRTQSDRRVELVKLFGLLRSDGIFPSAVTLGQYTKALAEGYSKRLTDIYKADENGFEVIASHCPLDLEEALNNLDTTLHTLEHHGRKWQQRNTMESGLSAENGDEGDIDAKMKRMDSRTWHPVVYSSSFVPCSLNRSSHYSEPIRLIALWSRTRCCSDCSYIPLEEEIEAGWDSYNGKNDIPAAIGCPRCDNPIVPMLGFREMSIDEALNIHPCSTLDNAFSEPGTDFKELPPQIGPIVDSETSDQRISYVTYINPSVLRDALEHYVEEYGDGVLDRDQLRDLDLEVFVNFWWYCARFSLPLPLPTSMDSIHLCAFAAWDRSTAQRGCYSAAKAIQPLFRPSNFENDSNLATSSNEPSQVELFDDVPLLSRFNLQGFYSNVWDHPDLSKLLVSLVEACDKRDLKAVIESAVHCNKRRVDAVGNLPDITIDYSRYGTINSMVSFGGNTVQMVELDIYRVVLYLAKYQCTSAFHSFFPTTLKSCKGYHFWCASGTPLPTFDRLFRDAVCRVNKKTKDKSLSVATQDLSDTSLAFRCVFGHLI